MTREEALSAIAWWQEAGVDILVDEHPRDWLQPQPPRPAPTAPAVIEPASPTPSTQLASPAVPRIGPAGDPASGLMLLVDHPEQGDIEADMLMSGPAGKLLNAMLAAIGRGRDSTYVAPLSPVRPVSGRIADAEIAELSPQALQLIAVTTPRFLLLMGDAPSRAILGMPVAEARGRLHELNHAGVTLKAMATFHPRFLLRQPRYKAAAWSDLRLLLEELGR